jgi:hypothetical protein
MRNQENQERAEEDATATKYMPEADAAGLGSMFRSPVDGSILWFVRCAHLDYECFASPPKITASYRDMSTRHGASTSHGIPFEIQSAAI